MNRALIPAVAGLLVTWLPGAEAVFSSDGAKVYLRPLSDAPFINELHLPQRKIDQHSLATWAGKSGVTGLSRGIQGEILFCTANAAWKWQPAIGKCEKLCDPNPGETFMDIAYDPRNRWTLLTTLRQNPRENESRHGLSLRRDDSMTLASVLARRVDQVEGPVFDSRGNLFFGSHGDLWQGQIQWDGERDAGRGVLHAYRICPVATLETSMETPAQTGARSTAVAGDRLYLHVKRMGGSGWGDIVRLKVPPAAFAVNGELDLVHDLQARMAVYQNMITSMEHLSQDGSWAHLCATSDGHLIHYTTGGEKGRVHWLVRDHGPPEQLSGLRGTLK